jgi:hypothetical protein
MPRMLGIFPLIPKQGRRQRIVPIEEDSFVFLTRLHKEFFVHIITPVLFPAEKTAPEDSSLSHRKRVAQNSP